jgi:6-phosphogluconolactonase (cycloisomerase 2 family)
VSISSERGRRISAFALTISLAGCAGHGATSAFVPQAAAPAASESAAASPTADGTMYLVSRDSDAVLGFVRTAQGNTKPTAMIAGSNTLLSAPDALALDPKSGNIYVVNDGGQGTASDKVLIFPRGANGNVTPKVLGGSKVPFKNSESVAVDASGKIYVADYNAVAIYVFPAGATGDTAPIRTIKGHNTMLTDPVGMAFDVSGDLYVTNTFNTTAQIVEFAPNAKGNVTPIATIGGSNTKLGSYVFNVSIDPKGRIVAANSTSVVVFPAGAHGNTQPLAVISGGATGLNGVISVGTDVWSNIYATNYDASKNVSSVVVFGPHAHGNNAPQRVISGANTGLSEPVYPSFY